MKFTHKTDEQITLKNIKRQSLICARENCNKNGDFQFKLAGIRNPKSSPLGTVEGFCVWWPERRDGNFQLAPFAHALTL